MTVTFNNVLPLPLQDFDHSSDSVWLNSFSLEFPKKILLNASSGKGKSTFINTLCGLRKDYTGEIKIDGKVISALKLDDWIEFRKFKISAVFQDLQLFPDLTVWENLQLKNNLTQHQTEARITEMLNILGIGNKTQQICATLSLGQQQRVAIIRALLQPFELLLLDEPFSHLDDHNASLALELIIEETDRNQGGFILTTLGSHHGYQFEQELNL